MTNTFGSKMVGSNRDADSSFLRAASNSSPTKGKPKSVRNSPRGKSHNDNNQEWDNNRVRFGVCSYYPARGSPNGKTRTSPSKSPRQSPSTYSELYAGFSDSPAPAALPKPPSHWMNSIQAARSCHSEAIGFASNIKMLLNAQA